MFMKVSGNGQKDISRIPDYVLIYLENYEH